MPPKGNKSARKKVDDLDGEEFQAMLSQLSKATKAHGKELQKQTARVETKKKEASERHEAIAKKSASSEMELYLERQQQQRQLQALFQQMMLANRPYLSAPKSDFKGEERKLDGVFDIAVGEMQGWRTNMEDAYVVDLSVGDSCGLFAVFDGHAGDQCSKQNKILLPALVRKHMKDEKTKEVDFKAAYLELDTVLRGRLKDDSGSTAVSVMVTPASVTCSNVGDSRAVLCRAGKAINLSEDHKPEDELERKRIEALGGHVANNRVNGQLAMSRAIGDYSYKQKTERGPEDQLVIAVPDVTKVDRTAEDTFVVVACDGIFDVLSNQDLVTLISEEMKKGQSLIKICETVCRTCLAPPSEVTPGEPSRAAGTDNMTILIAKLL